jgi:prepilin-type N-terminal cleavage/methylation domain-containing protein
MSVAILNFCKPRKLLIRNTFGITLMRNIKNYRRTGFTLIEILVVIAIIAVLAGILLAALSGVQKAAKKTKTTTLMQAFGRACDEFALDHGRYPGILPDSVIDGTTITPTQNALLELMGGARVKSSSSTSTVVNEFDEFENNTAIPTMTMNGWSLSFNPTRFGEGPWINGRVYEPYFSPKSSDLEYTEFDTNDASAFSFPALVDSWDTPIIYLRAVRKSGPIIALGSNNPLPQYDLPGMSMFVDNALNSNSSLLSETNQSNEERIAWLTLLIAHPTFWEIDPSNANNEFTNGAAWGTSRGRYILISAGPNAIFLEASNDQVHTDNWSPNSGNAFDQFRGGGPTGGLITPATMETFDDVVVHGGA